jgi:hypothetical protein
VSSDRFLAKRRHVHRGRELVGALAIARAHVPTIGELAESRGRRAAWIAPTVGVLCALGLALMVIGFIRFFPLHVGKLLAVGLGCAVVVFFALRPALAHAVRGNARAYGRYIAALTMTGAACIIYGLGLPVLLNGALDGDAIVVRAGRVSAIGNHDDDAKSTAVIVTWDDGTTTGETFEDPTSHALFVGEPVRAHLHRGRFGAPWMEDVIAGSDAR